MLEILDRIATGVGDEVDIEKLERLGKLVMKSSLCGLGRAAPNPILSTLSHFRDEYLAHVRDRVCPTGSCPMKPERPETEKEAPFEPPPRGSEGSLFDGRSGERQPAGSEVSSGEEAEGR